MEFPVFISRRKVKRVRLQLNSKGLLLIVPQNFSGDIDKILEKHEPWIRKHASKLFRMKQQIKNLKQYHRSQGELESLIEKYLTEGQSLLAVNPAKVSFRKMKTRWGSCSSAGNLSFNKKLRHLPEELVRYVVLHELTHLRHHNHSKQFWALLGEHDPNYAEHKTQLKLYGLLLEEM